MLSLGSRSQTPKGQRARERILVGAERLLATHGFHGTSIRDVAKAARLPLATVVYHFAKKAQLYAAVLGAIGGELVHELIRATGPVDPHAGPRRLAGQVDALAVALVRWTAREPERVRLLLRELLDNPSRVARASQLPLAPVLEHSAAIVAAASAAGVVRVTSPELAVLHLVGGISYVVAAWPTVQRIVGAGASQLAATYEREAIAFARNLFGLPPSGEEKDHGSRPAVPARPPRARAPRAANHRRRRRPDDARRRRVHRRGPLRARARQAVSRAAPRDRPRLAARGGG